MIHRIFLNHKNKAPRNEALFKASALRFIVLDEIHTYHGAQATEVAFLLRKLKNRLGLEDSLRVFGTSASLADGLDADEQLKEFASGLFGERVDEVVRGRRIVHHSLQSNEKSEFSLSVTDWISIGQALEDWSRRADEDQSATSWNTLIDDLGLSKPQLMAPDGEHLGVHLQRAFSRNKEVRSVARILDAGGVMDFRHLAQEVFGPSSQLSTMPDRYRALSSTIRLGMMARTDDGGFPLLPGRYHFAVNSIEGVSVLLDGSEEGWSKLSATKCRVKPPPRMHRYRVWTTFCRRISISSARISSCGSGVGGVG